jgi:hypothetical protein
MCPDSPTGLPETFSPEQVTAFLQSLLDADHDTLRRLGQFHLRLFRTFRLRLRRGLAGVDSHFTKPAPFDFYFTTDPIHVTVETTATALYHCVRLFAVALDGTLTQIWPAGGACETIDVTTGSFDLDLPVVLARWGAFVLKLYVEPGETETDSIPFFTLF